MAEELGDLLSRQYLVYHLHVGEAKLSDLLLHEGRHLSAALEHELHVLALEELGGLQHLLEVIGYGEGPAVEHGELLAALAGWAGFELARVDAGSHSLHFAGVGLVPAADDELVVGADWRDHPRLVVGDPRERFRDLREEAVGLEEVEAVHVFGPEVVDVEGYERPEQQPVHHRGEERDDVGVRGPHHVYLPDRREGEKGGYRE